MMKTALLAAAVLLLTGTAAGRVFASEPPAVKADGFYIPVGNPEKGRQLFAVHKCLVCHQVPLDPGLPEPAERQAGPALGDPDVLHFPGELADAIISPAHSVPAAYAMPPGTDLLSPMPSYRDVLTVGELSDIVAYLISFEE